LKSNTNFKHDFCENRHKTLCCNFSMRFQFCQCIWF